jgi:hypothetical protein
MKSCKIIQLFKPYINDNFSVSWIVTPHSAARNDGGWQKDGLQ